MISLKKGRETSERVLFVGLLFLFISLGVAGAFLYKGAQNNRAALKGEEVINEANGEASPEKQASWETYVDDEFGYAVSYPPLLEPRTIKSDSFLSFIIFFAPEGIKSSGLAISVRNTSLKEELALIKEEVQKDPGANLISEEEITKDGFSGIRLKYEPMNPESGEPREIVIINNQNYSYTISSTPEQLERILPTFKLVE